MAIDAADRMTKRRKRAWMWAAVVTLGVGIVMAAGQAVRLIRGFLDGMAELLREMLF